MNDCSTSSMTSKSELIGAIDDIVFYGATEDDIERWIEEDDRAHLLALRLL